MLNKVTIMQKLIVFLSKLLICCAFVIILLPWGSYAQDNIYKTDKTIIASKVMEISDSEIKYKKFSNLTGPTYIIPKNEVWMIVYENGDKELFNQAATNQQETSKRSNEFLGVTKSNPDIIITSDGKNINCIIDKVDKTMVYYYVKGPSYDPTKTIALTQVIKYLYKNQWYNGYGTAASTDNSANEKARKFIIDEKINDAISTYAKIISTDSTNAVLLAEGAYALALGGVYEAALMRLDRSWNIDANSSDVKYFTAQIFALMGYDDLAKEFWKVSDINKPPVWVSSKSSILMKKFKCKLPCFSLANHEKVIASFYHANELASRNSNFQSIALFRKIIDIYPNEYLPYVGYSITLENAGVLEKSAQSIEKAISLIGNNTEDIQKKQILEQRLVSIKRKMTLVPAGTLPRLGTTKVMESSPPQMMAYVGGMIGKSNTSVNGRIGYFISGSSNASLDFGVAIYNNKSSTNIGLSIYNRKSIFVSGGGLSMSSASGNTTFYGKLSAGISKMNKNKSSSIDLFADVNQGLKKDSFGTWGFSIGTSYYFGRRK